MTGHKLQLWHIAKLFLKVGAQSYGGWSTTVVLLERELEKQHISAKQVDVQAAAAYAQILPGATQVAIVSNVGHQLYGARGSVVATVAYLVPAVSLILVFAVLYFQFLVDTAFASSLEGLVAALAGVILANAYRIGTRHVRHPALWLAVALAAAAMLLLQTNALFILLAYGLMALLVSLYVARKGRA